MLRHVALGFILGASLVSLLWWAKSSIDAHIAPVKFMSDYQYPVKQILLNIVESYDTGDPARAEKQVRLLSAKWSAWMHEKGQAPEGMMDVILVDKSTTLPSTQPTRRD